jgi:hypothetical protein
MPSPRSALVCLGALAPLALLTPRSAEGVDDVPSLTISRANGPIAIDAKLDDAGWQGVAPVETWFETNPGDNVPPPVKNVGYVAYDDRFLYAAFVFQDPEPSRIRAPLGDRDNVPSETDYGGIILDPRNDGRTGFLFLANARGIQFDSVIDDASGNEDASPDFYWDAAARITSDGWILEMRVPFSSLRYRERNPAAWGIMLYRNYPRAYRYQFFTTRLPRGGSCFVCRANKMTGLSGLPGGGHVVVAPYVNASQSGSRDDQEGAPFQNHHPEADVGFDVKWTPGASTAVDATVNPDFSQVESDVAQIGANERFALFFPEKRPFFLEGSELFRTPIQAVYSRTVTSPRWGLRSTGKTGRLAYTALFTQDRGGGQVVLPGPNSSDLADQDFRSFVGIARARYDLGRSFLSMLATDREVEGGGYNRVFGPDVQWRRGDGDVVTGQFLLSRSITPERTDLAAEWDGRRLAGHGADAWWLHTRRHVDWIAEYKDFGDEFRADDGFVPQVGYRQTYGEAGLTFRPSGLLRRIRTFVIADRSTDRDGDLLNRRASFGVGMDGRFVQFARLQYADDRVRTGDLVLPRRQLLYWLFLNPGRLLSSVAVYGFVGEQIDFDNHRPGTGASIAYEGTLRPTKHLELRFNGERRWLDVDDPSGGKARLFTAQVDRVRTTYTFTSRMFLRAIVQYVETRRDPSLYIDAVDAKEGGLSGSVLFAYKLNWQTVLFLGYGDESALDERGDLRRSKRDFFLKVSYAFQR